MSLQPDKHGFLDVISNASHRPLLLLALEETKGSVLELGMGDGSTPYLNAYCEAERRTLISIDNSPEWCARFQPLSKNQHGIVCVSRDWSDVAYPVHGSVALVDHAPEARRHVDAIELAERFLVVVIHDTEPECPGYFMDRVWPHYKYRANLRPNRSYMGAHAHASAVSNYIDVTKWVGTTFPNYPFEVEP